MSGGGGSAPSKQTTTQEPPAYLKPYLIEAADAAAAEFKQGPTSAYPGSTVLPFNQYQQSSMQGMLDTVNSGAYQALNNSAMEANSYALNLPQNIQNNQQLKAIADANTQNVQKNLVENTLRQIRGEAVSTGNLDSTRTSIREGQAIGNAATAAADANARMYGDAYNNALKYSQVAQSQIPGLQNAMLQPHQVAGTVGDAYASLDQARANESMTKYYEEQNREAANISEYLSLLQGSSAGGSTTTKGQTAGPSSASRLLGAGMGGMGAYGMASSIPALAGMATPIGWGAAALSLMM